MHYYQHHIGDFIKDTSFLTNEEIGIYLKLIWIYYDSENPLPNNLFELGMKTGTRDNQIVLEGLLEMFFVLDEQNKCWHHTRCNKEIENYKQQLTTASKAGKASALKRAMNKNTTSVELALNERSTDVQPTNNHKPLTINQEPNISICPPSGELEDSKIPKCEHQSVIDMYHKYLPTLRKVEVWNTARQGYLRQRWREVAIELSKEKDITAGDILTWFADFFQHIGASKFLTGKVNSKDGRAFTADLEWILKPSNFAKIVEGKYHGTN